MAECIRRVRRRDEAAARVFMDRLYPLVLKVVRANLPRRMGEDDLVQMVFLKVFTHLDSYAGQAPVEHWVSRIAVNTCLNAIKAEKVRPEWRWSDLSEEQQHVLETLAAEDVDWSDVERLAARDLLDRLLSQLKPQEQLVIRLLHLEERSIAEIRSLTGWTTATVKIRAFRARRKLRALLDQMIKENRL